MGEDGGSDVVERDERERIVTFIHFGPTVQAGFAGGSTLGSALAVSPLPLQSQ